MAPLHLGQKVHPRIGNDGFVGNFAIAFSTAKRIGVFSIGSPHLFENTVRLTFLSIIFFHLLIVLVTVSLEVAMDLHSQVVAEIKEVLKEMRATIGTIETMESFAKNNIELCHIVSEMPGEEASVAAFWQLTYMTAMHMRYGEPIFSISPNLARLLQDTEIPKVEIELLKLPFPCIMLDIRSCPLIVKETQAVCIYLAQPEDKFRIFAGCEDSTGLFVNLVTDPEYNIKTILDAFDATVARSIADGNRTIDDPILKALATWSQVHNNWGQHKDKFMTEYKQLLTLAINSILYITSPQADIIRSNELQIRTLNEKLRGLKKGIKRESIEKLLVKAKERKIHIVGRSVAIQPEYIANYTEEGRKVAFRHRVRGHWKLVHFGKNKEMLKQVWIQPYWRGPTMAELLASNYLVAEPKR
jgi:hypothetical protein